MASRLVFAAILALAPIAAAAQEIVEVPASRSQVARPDDLFALAPGQWHLAKSHALGHDPCLPDQCEAGFTSGELVISVEHAKTFVLIIAGFRGCDRVAFNELEVDSTPGKSAYRRISREVKTVVKGLAKSCRMDAPDVPRLDAVQLFPKAAA